LARARVGKRLLSFLNFHILTKSAFFVNPVQPKKQLKPRGLGHLLEKTIAQLFP
jgi:hypothetical protein